MSSDVSHIRVIYFWQELRNHHGIATTPIRHAPTTYAHLSRPIVTPCTDLSGEPLSEPC